MKRLFSLPLFFVCSILLQPTIWDKKGLARAEECSSGGIGQHTGLAHSFKTLTQDLLCGYDRMVTPFLSNGSIAEVEIGVYIYRLDLDVHRGYLQMLVDMSWEWHDSRLSWDPAEYNDISATVFTDNEIWVPDLEAINSMQRQWDPSSPLRCRAESTGRVMCNPVYTLHTTCGTSARLWPFDTHDCEFDLASRNHDSREYTMKMTYNTSRLSMHSEASDEWEVVSSSQDMTTLSYGADSGFLLSRIIYRLTLARRAEVHVSTMAVPALVLCCLVLAQLWMDPDWPGRVLLGCTVFACSLLQLYYLSESAPDDTLGQAPLIVLFYRDLLYMDTGVVVLGVLLSALSGRQDAPPAFLTSASSWVVRGLSRVPGPAVKLLLADDAELEADTDLADNDPKDTSSVHTAAWRRLAKITDRLLFLVLTITFIVMLIAFVP